MSVTATSQVAAGLYTPFRGFDREAGPVGTLSVNAEVTGDASGGSVTAVISMAREEFGFHPIWVPTRVGTRDVLAVAEAVEFTFRGSGNDRLDSDIEEGVLATRVVGALNLAAFVALGVAIEVVSLPAVQVVQARWATNTNTLLYHLHVYGVLYDGTALARGKEKGKSADLLLGGVR